MVAALIRRCLTLLAFAAVPSLGLHGPAYADWLEGAPIAQARAFGAAASIGDTVYVAGGAGIEATVADFAAYDTIGDIWRPLPTMPSGRQGFGMAALDGAIYVSGGYAGDEFDQPSRELWRYDAVTAVWLQMPDMPSARARHGMAAIDGKLYVIGGEGPNASRVLVFDGYQGEWRDFGADLPVPRKDLGIVVAAGRVYAVGGRTGSGVTGRVDALDVSARRWTSAPDLPAPRADAAIGVVGSRIHVAGGRSNDPMRTFAEHYVLDANGGRWASEAPLPLPRLGAASAGSENGFVVVGGSGGAGVFSLFTTTDVVNIYK